jgi:hypothetical protein
MKVLMLTVAAFVMSVSNATVFVTIATCFSKNLQLSGYLCNKLTRCTIFSLYCVTTQLHGTGPFVAHYQEAECIVCWMVFCVHSYVYPNYIYIYIYSIYIYISNEIQQCNLQCNLTIVWTEGVALLFLKPRASCVLVINATPLPLYHWKRIGIPSIGGWVGQGTLLDRCEKSRLHRDSIPGTSSA